MTNTNVVICLSGSAGQGVVSLGQMLAKALVRHGYQLHCWQVYESRVRGGEYAFFLRCGSDIAYAPVEAVDILVPLNPESFAFNRDSLVEQGLILSDDTLPAVSKNHLRVPLKAMGAGAHPNTVMFGALCALLGFTLEEASALFFEYLGKLGQEAIALNKDVLTKAYSWSGTQKHTIPLPQVASGARDSKMMLNGNEAIAMGAMAGGVKFCSFYPMSPSTPVALQVADAAVPMGIVVEQTEDELAALNMAIGASFAGAPSMVSTSGGGFTLMTEAVSLAGMAEIPVVIILAMRPGPATGLAARTEQADLALVLHAGHGEFPRAILAPASLNQCFDLTRQAFALAEKYRGPVFVLTDQYLADSYRDNALFDLSAAPSLPGALQSDTLPYESYAYADGGVSPRRLPGFGKALVVGTGDEHTPDGHITEDLTVRPKMQEKRMAKHSGLTSESLPPLFSGEASPEIMLICWGSTAGAVEEAAALLRATGKTVGVCQFIQLWPLRPETFLPQLVSSKHTVMVEGNYTGQMASLIRAETGFDVTGAVHRYDGLAITADYIMARLPGALQEQGTRHV